MDVEMAPRTRTDWPKVLRSVMGSYGLLALVAYHETQGAVSSWGTGPKAVRPFIPS